jgi:hypothetical protein
LQELGSALETDPASVNELPEVNALDNRSHLACLDRDKLVGLLRETRGYEKKKRRLEYDLNLLGKQT